MVTSGAFAGMPGTVAAPAEVAARWPDNSGVATIKDDDGVWVLVPVFGQDVPVLMELGWVAAR